MRLLRCVSLFLCLFLSPGVVLAELLDPTRPPNLEKVAKVRKDGVYTLTAIYYSQGRKLAIINGKLVKKGDTINGGRVKEISPNVVHIQGPGKPIVLPLVKHTIKEQHITMDMLNRPSSK